MNYGCLGDYLKTLPENTVFRVWKKKTIFTPLEQEKKSELQNVYENDVAYFVYIRAVIDLPNGDLLLAVESADCEGYVDYYKLSEIDLAKFKPDMEETI